MNYRFAPLVLCAFVAASTSLAESTVSARTISPSAAAVNVPRAIRSRARSRAASVCTGPDTTGPHSFNGVPNVGNIAGDVAPGNNPDPSPYAGVVAGCGNVAGDIATGILAGSGNTIQAEGPSGGDSSSSAVIVGGGGNSIGDSPGAFIGAGGGNTIGGAIDAVIAAGGINTIYGPQAAGYGYDSFSGIVAGTGNYIGGNGTSFIGAGTNNAINLPAQGHQYASSSVIVGGDNNQVTGTDGAVLGGTANVASGFAAAIGGGSTNTASGRQAVVPGGELNVASGMNSFAGGTRSVATKAGSFVWSDDATGAKTVTASIPNVFLVRASGGVAFYSAANLASGVSLAPGSGAWSTLSDRNVKTGIERVDETRILAKLAAMPVSEWSYAAQGSGVRHLGPMAQDFRAAFGLGEDDRHISTVDEEGVALAAIKALQAENVSLKSDNALLHEAHRADEARLARLETRLSAVEMQLLAAAK